MFVFTFMKNNKISKNDAFKMLKFNRSRVFYMFDRI